MRYIFLTIGTAILGICISFVLPPQSGSNIVGFMTAPIHPDGQSISQSVISTSDPSDGSTDGFGRLLPTPTQTEGSAQYRAYQQKVHQLLSRLEEKTDRSSYTTIALNNTSLPASDTLSQSVPSLREEDQILSADSGKGQTTNPPHQRVAGEATTNVGELEENPNDRIQRIALLGDSMIDTLGRDLPYLRKKLESSYPEKVFMLYNYGHGSTNLDQGCARLTQETTYLTTTYPPIVSMKPQIIVLESFAYNHWSAASHDLDRHWITLARCIDIIKKESPNTRIILAATIAPNAQINGSALQDFSPENRREWNTTTHAYLQNMLRFAVSEKYPLADAYTPSLDQTGQGHVKYIDTTDHLHPSDAGKILFSETVADTIVKNGMIQ